MMNPEWLNRRQTKNKKKQGSNGRPPRDWGLIEAADVDGEVEVEVVVVVVEEEEADDCLVITFFL